MAHTFTKMEWALSFRYLTTHTSTNFHLHFYYWEAFFPINLLTICMSSGNCSWWSLPVLKNWNVNPFHNDFQEHLTYFELHYYISWKYFSQFIYCKISFINRLFDWENSASGCSVDSGLWLQSCISHPASRLRCLSCLSQTWEIYTENRNK